MSKKVMLLVVFILVVFGFWGCQKQVDIEVEKEAIIAVINKQLDAIKTLSFEGEAAVWAHMPYIERRKVVGWDSVSIYYQKFFAENKKIMEKDPENNIIKKYDASNFDIYINGNFASVFHDEHHDYIWEGTEVKDVGRVHKYLEKIDGKWKVIAIF